MVNQMFKNDRYITSGINSNIPVKLQILMWELIDMVDIEMRDYLQVFRLEVSKGKDGGVRQKIIHTQEEPHYKKQYYINTEEAISEKIFTIDDGKQSVMMLVAEY